MYGYSSSQHGHIGIYIGKDMLAHNVSSENPDEMKKAKVAEYAKSRIIKQ